jgi:hypothetical protein
MYQLVTLGGPPFPRAIRIPIKSDTDFGLTYGREMLGAVYSNTLKLLIWQCLAEKPHSRPGLDDLHGEIGYMVGEFDGLPETKSQPSEHPEPQDPPLAATAAGGQNQEGLEVVTPPRRGPQAPPQVVAPTVSSSPPPPTTTGHPAYDGNTARPQVNLPQAPATVGPQGQKRPAESVEAVGPAQAQTTPAAGAEPQDPDQLVTFNVRVYIPRESPPVDFSPGQTWITAALTRRGTTTVGELKQSLIDGWLNGTLTREELDQRGIVIQSSLSARGPPMGDHVTLHDCGIRRGSLLIVPLEQ